MIFAMGRNFWRKFSRDRFGVVALAVVIVFVLSAVAVEIYSIYCDANSVIPVYLRSNPDCCYAPPSPEHWFGTDYQGRDVAFRAIAGANTALKVGLISGAISLFTGVVLGLFSGYYGGRTDEFTVWLYSTFAAMPTLLFILAFSLLVSQGFLSPPLLAVFNFLAKLCRTEPGMFGVYCAIGLTGWVTLCRVIRSEVMKLRTRPYVAAAKVAGVSNFRIIFRHILPNVFHLAIIYFTTLFAASVMLEVTASYLGLGAQNFPSWGMMISDGQQRLWAGVWWELAAASGMLFILVLALNILGDSLRDTLDPRR